jgi:low temperature requirement protein LtrA
VFVPVWWSWWGYTWYSARFNEDDAVNRVALIVAMLGIGGLASGVAGAGEAPTSTFVVAYAGLFAVLAVLYARAWRRIPQMRALTARYGLAYAVGAGVWLASLAVEDGERPVVWAVAMIVLMGGPVLAAASTPILSYAPEHIAERYGLFTLIVLGESIVAVVAGLDTGS